MFELPFDARFARDDAESELRAGFAALADRIGDDGDGTATEVLWGALHGISVLKRAGRMRAEHRPVASRSSPRASARNRATAQPN